MPDVFDSHYEEAEYCELVHKCRSEKCLDDLYLLPGWDRTLPIVRGDLGDRFDGYVNKYFNNHDTYSCANLPMFKTDHQIEPVVDALVKEIDRNSGDKKVALLGSSYGGILAQRMASTYPERVSKLALLFSWQRMLNGDVLGIPPREIKNIVESWWASDRIINFFRDIFTPSDTSNPVEASDEFLGRPQGFLNLLAVNEAKNNQKITAKTFVLNCLEDKIFGEIPNIAGATVKINSPCQHHRMEERDLKMVAEFLEEESDI